MKVFHCDHCRSLVFFENVRCLTCNHALAFLPDRGDVGSLDPAGGDLWTSPRTVSRPAKYRLCRNYDRENVCNWAVPTEDPNPLCRSCRLTRVIPDLMKGSNKEVWYRLEVAKRRLVYGLLTAGLPVESQLENPVRGLAFDLLDDAPRAGASPVLTGHAAGVITISVAEADDAERERRRVALHEPYRTLLGHFRHESGHYYWDRLIRDGDGLAEFRSLFGDEQESYDAALRRHYDEGAPADWQQSFASAYATAHPWEDWAETWAHYLHMADAIETATASGLSLQPSRRDEPALESDPEMISPIGSFERLIGDWIPLTYVLNNLNRGLGLPDAYPFVLSAKAIEKLAFVHRVVSEAKAGRSDIRPEPATSRA